jgi:predicted amidohydrolase YtcJ
MPADAVFRVGRAYGMTADRGVYQAVAELVLYPAFADTHNHQLLAARDLEDGSVGVLAAGAFADIVGFRGDLLDCPVDDLPSRQPVLTLVGGRPVHDPDGLARAG